MKRFAILTPFALILVILPASACPPPVVSSSFLFHSSAGVDPGLLPYGGGCGGVPAPAFRQRTFFSREVIDPGYSVSPFVGGRAAFRTGFVDPFAFRGVGFHGGVRGRGLNGGLLHRGFRGRVFFGF